MSKKVWSYGVTSVLRRRDDLLPKTLESLKAGGFEHPRLFLDGYSVQQSSAVGSLYQLPVTSRDPMIGLYPSWLLSLLELYLRNPESHFYAMFQDDIVCCSNLREYIEMVVYPPKSYLNLCLWPSNVPLIPVDDEGNRMRGFFPSNGLGHGGQALVFDRGAVLHLLTHQDDTEIRSLTTVNYMMERPLDAHRSARSMDGGVCMALKRSNYQEYVHNPSLVYHVAPRDSTYIGLQNPDTMNWLGKDYNPLELLAPMV